MSLYVQETKTTSEDCGLGSVYWRRPRRGETSRDLVIGRDGEPCRVTGVFPQGRKSVYRVTMTDGAETECCDDHLWLTQAVDDRSPSVRQGSSVHNGIEVLAFTGNLQFALDALDNEDPYANAKERAMLTGYYARWGPPTGVIAVEKEWTMDLVNPETGAKSKTFRLGGKIDRLVEVA